MSEAPFLPQEVIRKKRDGLPVTGEDIDRFVAGITDGSVTHAQISAFAMAVFFKGMSAEEGAALTLAMRDSGDVMDHTGYGPIVDKHSTGGVGDKVSLMLAPIVAACGAHVPMISGRGLGHTGGTLDKLQAIPGYDPFPDNKRFSAITRDVGCSIIGQTGNLAPADKTFYSVRDVTSTVESIPLITASILSKKLAAGLESLVMDVKFGTGAFMDTLEKAEALATNIVRVAGATGLPASALLTDMNQVLGRTAGNAVEVIEAVEFLLEPEKAEPRLKAVTLDLAGEMVALSGCAEDAAMGRERAEKALNSGKAARVFGEMVAAQGGPADFMETFRSSLELATVRGEVMLEAGYVSAMDTRMIGTAVILLGGGRTDPALEIDHSVGLTDIAGIGEEVSDDKPFCRILARDEATLKAASDMIRAAVVVSSERPVAGPVTAKIIRG